MKDMKKCLEGDAEKEERSKKQLWRVFLILLIVAVLAAAAFFLRFFMFSRNSPRLFSEETARRELAAYLNEKYSEWEFKESDFQLIDHKIYSRLGQRKIGYGYCGTIGNSDERRVCILCWNGIAEDGSGMMCFDNLQQEQIAADMKEEMLNSLGMEEGMFNYSSSLEEDMMFLMDHDTSLFHTLYQGDLDTFFREESVSRSKMVKGFWKEGLYDTEKAFSPNGSCMLVVRDPSVKTLEEKLHDTEQEDVYGLKRLESQAEKFGVQITATVLPQDFYDSIRSTRYESKLMEKHSFSYEDTVFLTPLVSSWYKSGNSEYESVFQKPRAWESADGVYIFPVVNVAAAKSVSDHQQETGADRSYRVVTSGREEAVSKSLKEYQISAEKVWPYIVACSLDEEVWLVLDKEALGIKEGQYTVFRRGWQDTKCRKLEIIKEAGKMTAEDEDAAENVADIGGYLIVKCRAGAEDTADMVLVAE